MPRTCRVSPSMMRAGPVMSALAGTATNRSAARALLNWRTIGDTIFWRNQNSMTWSSLN